MMHAFYAISDTNSIQEFVNKFNALVEKSMMVLVTAPEKHIKIMIHAPLVWMLIVKNVRVNLSAFLVKLVTIWTLSVLNVKFAPKTVLFVKTAPYV